LWITDFGLAKAAEATTLTKSGELVGTLPYMAPESSGAGAIRERRLFLGLVLYELLTLRPASRTRTAPA